MPFNLLLVQKEDLAAHSNCLVPLLDRINFLLDS